MTIQRSRLCKVEAGAFCANLADELRQVALQMDSHSEEIRGDDDLVGAASSELVDSRLKVRVRKFEKRGHPESDAATLGRYGGGAANRLVGIGYAGAVREYDETNTRFRHHWRLVYHPIRSLSG